VIEDYLQAFFTSLGFTNPLQVAWELVPLSFVVNWFVDVSSALETYDIGDRGVSVYDEYITYTTYCEPTKVRITFDDDLVYNLGEDGIDSQTPGEFEIAFVDVSRERYVKQKDENLMRVLAHQNLDNIFSPSKALTALQLLWQRSK
jgi:hypothetical protein